MANLKYSEWGLGNRFGDDIVLNINLKQFPKLHNSLLQHELKHNEYPIFNIKHDYKSLYNTPVTEWIVKIFFMFRHPKSLVQLSPVYIYDGRPYFDISLIIMYVLAFAIYYFL